MSYAVGGTSFSGGDSPYVAVPAGSWATSPRVRKAMLSNRSRDTVPEKELRSALHRLGLRFRKDRLLQLEDVRVRPDIVFPRARVAVFLDGCFWHRCPEHASDPKTHSDYWGPKLEANVSRDRRVDAALSAAGWQTVRVWEHEAPADAAKRVAAVIAARDLSD
jgi:DNA mismatch endonuclease (patch repair protein)